VARAGADTFVIGSGLFEVGPGNYKRRVDEYRELLAGC
jgi:pentose-5-phosphate-3-epimerase